MRPQAYKTAVLENLPATAFLPPRPLLIRDLAPLQALGLFSYDENKRGKRSRGLPTPRQSGRVPGARNDRRTWAADNDRARTRAVRRSDLLALSSARAATQRGSAAGHRRAPRPRRGGAHICL